MMILKISITKLGDKSLINLYFVENDITLKNFEFDPEEGEIQNIKKMFDYILQNIEKDFTFNKEDIDETSDSTLVKIAIKYLDILKLEINDIKKNLVDQNLVNDDEDIKTNI